MLYSKNGSIPKPQTDGTDGWIEVPEPPIAPEGKEVIWLYPPGWVVRDPKPAATENGDWSWIQSEQKWIQAQIALIDDTITISAEQAESLDIMTTATAMPT